MKTLFLTIILFIGFVSSFSIAQEPYPCHTDEKRHEFLNSLTTEEKILFQNERDAYEQEIQQYIAQHPELLVPVKSGAKTISYTIPVVFHIIHQDGAENISNEQILDGLKHMNLDFQKANSEWPNTVSQFIPIIADMQIEFKLAKKDPNGNCTNGITRTFSNTSVTGVGNDQVNAVKAVHGDWPGDKYLNIFVARYIGGAAGYSQYPNNWLGNKMMNGIFILHNYVGTIGTSGSSGKHTLSHEAGHWLNLAHLWGNSNDPGLPENCNEDDGVADTPNTIGWTTCNISGSTCDQTLDNVENFMEYSYCSKMFTNGQKARVHAALNSSVGGRNKIWSQNNLEATGVNLPSIVCKADFKANKQITCAENSISFTDLSYNDPTSWNWEFPGGNPATSTDQNPVVVYEQPGYYSVKLTVSDGTNSATETLDSFVKILPDASSLPFVEGFEGYNRISQSDWEILNYGNNEQFEVTSTVSQTGNHSIRLKNHGQPKGNIDAIISKPIDLSGIEEDDNLTLSFRYAYRKRKPENVEKLNIYITNSCGDIWSKRNVLSGNQLGEHFSSASWTPINDNEWITVHMTETNITQQFWVDNFRIKFEFESDGGNNLYIDNINLYKEKPIEEPFVDNNVVNSLSKDVIAGNFSIFPNPTSDILNVSFALKHEKNIVINIVNSMGEKVQSHYIKGQNGENLAVLDIENLSNGLYFIQINSENSTATQKFIKK